MQNIKLFIIVIVSILILIFISIWSDIKSANIKGPSRLLLGHQDTVYIHVDDQIVKTSNDGEVIETINLQDLNIYEPITDFFVETNGDILLGLQDSREIKLYSYEGKFVSTYLKLSSYHISNNLIFKFTKDPLTGILYVADTATHTIQIYGSDGMEIRALMSPMSQESETNKTFLYPNGLIFNNNRLYVADTDNNRIVTLYPDGTLDRIIMAISGIETVFTYPVRLSIKGNVLFVINRGPRLEGGDVAVIDLNNDRYKWFYPDREIDPKDILVRTDDVLTIDKKTRSILRFSIDGAPLGHFGQDSLNNIFLGIQTIIWVYQGVRIASLAGIFIIFIRLLFIYRKERKTSQSIRQDVIYKPIMIFQKILGVAGSTRRRMLLILLPGLGQAAAGRKLRAAILFLPLSFFFSIFLYSVYEILTGGYSAFSLMPASGLPASLLWVIAAIDAIRLNEIDVQRSSLFNIKTLVKILSMPIFTVVGGAVFQLSREKIVAIYPEITLAIQEVFYWIIVELGLSDPSVAVFSAMTPASMFLGWGGAVASIFATIAFFLKLDKKRIIIAAFTGFIVGMTSWPITATFIGTQLGSAFYQSPVQGLLIALSLYIYFCRVNIPPLIIPAAIAGAWLGDIIILSSIISLSNFIFFLGAGAGTAARTSEVIFHAYFIHVAILIVINALAIKEADNVIK